MQNGGPVDPWVLLGPHILCQVGGGPTGRVRPLPFPVFPEDLREHVGILERVYVRLELLLRLSTLGYCISSCSTPLAEKTP